MKLYLLKSIPYYNSIYQEYTNILVINKDPDGPLKGITKRVRLNKLSPFELYDLDAEKIGTAAAIKHKMKQTD